MKMIDNFTNKYSLSKTLRFSLIPQGKTEEWFVEKYLCMEEGRTDKSKNVKKMIDRYHTVFIERVLLETSLEELEEYLELYQKRDKDDNDKDRIRKLEENLRKSISKKLTDDNEFKDLFDKKMITERLPSFLESDDEKMIVEEFSKFTTYFTGYHTNRKNMYSAEEKSTAISYRIVNQNLPKFIDNIFSFKQMEKYMSAEQISVIKAGLNEITKVENLGDVFDISYFNCVLAQSGIDMYNQIIGGYTSEYGKKTQGVNEAINLYNQQNKHAKIPRMKMLYKQILSDRETISFIPEQFETDQEVLESIKIFYEEPIENYASYGSIIEAMKQLLENLDKFNLQEIYVKNDVSLTKISNDVYGKYYYVRDALGKEYDNNYTKKIKDIEKYEENKKKDLSKINSLSIMKIEELTQDIPNKKTTSISAYYKEETQRVVEIVNENYRLLGDLLNIEYSIDGKLSRDSKSVELIKNFLDSLKDFQRFVALFQGSGKEGLKDLDFYAQYTELLDLLGLVNIIYDKVRNYLTKKPYSIDKIKVTFNQATLLHGWDLNKEKDNLSILLRKDGKYFLAIIDKKYKSDFFDNKEILDSGNEYYEKMEYKLLPGPNKMLPKVFFSKSRYEQFKPSKELLDAYKNKTHIKGENFKIEDCHRLINFFKKSIELHEDWSAFGFEFSPTVSYENISQFYKEISDQAYKLKFVNLSSGLVDDLVENGKMYLFQIYNKDFSEYSKGTPNLHTIYFKSLFDKENLKNVVYKLNGEAEIFYRKASISKKDAILHPREIPVENKNPLNPKKESVFEYDLIKDKRFTKNQFLFHVPITMNYGATGDKINLNVRKLLKNTPQTHIIGIDRGERHLIYVSVIDRDGVIKEQFSLNEICNKKIKTDYHDLLDRKEKERLDARKNWSNIENIKELKEGYISQLVHKICELVEKYDAIVVMEDLNGGFKNSRIKVEKQIYQKFEKALITKLNFYINKQANPYDCGGAMKAYQLTNVFESFSKMGKQNGILFYVPAWNTSKIDPSTGFIDLIKPKYISIEASKNFFSLFDSIRFNKEENYFEFDIDYLKFPKGITDSKQYWTICSFGERIENYRNESGKWDGRVVDVTDKLLQLFKEYNILLDQDLRYQIVEQSSKDFFQRIIHLLRLTLQMRNSFIGTEIDYLISPVKNRTGIFYCSDNGNMALPDNADANGAYNIARKGLWMIEQFEGTSDENLLKVSLGITNKEWLKYAQSEKWKIQ